MAEGYWILKTLRAANGETQEDLMRVIGVKNVGVYNKKENGKTKFAPEEMRKIAAHYGKTVDEIFFANNVCIVKTSA